MMKYVLVNLLQMARGRNPGIGQYQIAIEALRRADGAAART
jgi:hypothetical protein